MLTSILSAYRPLGSNTRVPVRTLASEKEESYNLMVNQNSF